MSNNNVNIADEIKSRCNIADVIGGVVKLKKTGNNYKGLCPFHNEKTPSFIVSETKQRFTCYGCGAFGDVIEFVQRYYGHDFKGAVEMLAKEYGISLEGAFSGSRSKDKEELYEINRQAARFFYKELRRSSNPGYTYMHNRGISAEILNKFGIGYADDSWDSLYLYLRNKGFSEKKMLELGLISKSERTGRFYDKFRGRVIFPIQNTSGKVIGFGGRIIGEGEPKYLNSQESPVFSKKHNLYGLNLSGTEARKADSIVLVEGYMDVVSLYQSGVRNVSASLGTALTENQARLIRRYTKNVILSYDADRAGQNAAMRGLDILYREGCRARVLKVTDGKDPDEFVKKNGRRAFTELMENALPYGDFKLGFVKAKYDINDETQRVDFIKEAVDVLKGMTPVEADIYIKKLSAETGVSEGAIRFEYSGGGHEDKPAGSAVRQSRDGVSAEPAEKIPPVEKNLLKLMITDSAYIALPEDVKDIVFRSEQGMNMYENIVQLYCDDKIPDINALKDILDEEGMNCLEDIEAEIISPGTERTVYNECIAKIRKQKLKKQEDELIIRLNIAEDENNQEEINRLTLQLIEIQKKTKK